MSAISPLKLSLGGGWSNRIGGYYTLDVVVRTVRYHLFTFVREQILLYPVSGNEWDMKYLLPTATLSFSLSLSHTHSLTLLSTLLPDDDLLFSRFIPQQQH